MLADDKPRRAQLHPSRKNALDWALYTVKFDAARGEVAIRMDDGRVGRARVGKLAYGYDGDLHIEELGGPSLGLQKRAMERPHGVCPGIGREHIHWPWPRWLALFAGC